MDLEAARSFVANVDLSGTPRHMEFLAQSVSDDTGAVFDQAKNQAQVVASSIFSFAVGVDTQVREAISDSALLAQLVANKRVDFQTDPEKWFDAYASVLQTVGWVLQDSAWNDYSTTGNSAEVNQHIIDVLAVALGPGATAIAIAKATIDALQAMDTESPWIKLFDRETQKANLARFQVGLVEKGPNDDVFVSLIACIVKATKNITQVLFFKFRAEQADFRANVQKVSINRPALVDLGPVIRSKVRAYQLSYLSNLDDLGPIPGPA